MNAIDLGQWLDVLRAAAWRRASLPGNEWSPPIRSTSPGSFYSDHSTPVKIYPHCSKEDPGVSLNLNRTVSKTSDSDQNSVESSCRAEKPRLPPPPPAPLPRDSRGSNSSLAGRNLARVFGLLRELEYGKAPPRPPRTDSPPSSYASLKSMEHPSFPTSTNFSLRQPSIPPRGPSLSPSTEAVRRAFQLQSVSATQSPSLPVWCATR